MSITVTTLSRRQCAMLVIASRTAASDTEHSPWPSSRLTEGFSVTSHGPIIFFAINSMLIYKRILLFSRTVTDGTNHERKCDVFHCKPDYWRNVSGLSVPVWHPNFLTPGTCGGKKFIGDKKYNMRWISEMRTPQWLPGTWLLAQALKNNINSFDSTQPINHTYTEPKIFKYLQGSKYMIGFGWGKY